jgi:hypothetical protein
MAKQKNLQLENIERNESFHQKINKLSGDNRRQLLIQGRPRVYVEASVSTLIAI